MLGCRPTAAQSASCSDPRSLLVTSFSAQRLQAMLLLHAQIVLDADQQSDLGALDLALRRQDLIQLRGHLGLVRLRWLQQSDQSLHSILQLPLQLREARLSLQYFRAKISFLRV